MTENKLSLTMRMLEEMIARGWSAAAIAKLSGVNQITVGNIKNGKASRVTDKVHDRIAGLKARIDAGEVETPRRGRKSAGSGSTALPGKTETKTVKRDSKAPGTTAPRPTAARKKTETADDLSGMINRQYVPVDIAKLQGMIDQLIARFTDAANELEAIKAKLKS